MLRNRKKNIRNRNQIDLNLDGSGKSAISTGIGFFDHMLEQIAKHGNMDLAVNVKGDLHIDEHHTVEDVAISLGEAVLKALGGKKGLKDTAFVLPMDDCLAQVSLDFGGRPWLVWDVDSSGKKSGRCPQNSSFTSLNHFSDNARCNLNIMAEGENEHHKIEAIFKAFAKAVKMAVKQTDNYNLPSTKGKL